MTSDRSAPAWQGDVVTGVTAWVGERPERAAVPPPEDEAAAGPDADPESVARTILLDQLTGRARSRAELRTKLDSRQVPPEISERLLDRFTEVGLVDDAAFARSWVESRQAGKGLAPRALAQELRRKGVPDDVAREALEVVDEEAQRDAARRLVRRKLRSLSRVDTATATRRLVGMLGRKGYSSGLAFAVVREELAGRDDPPDELPG
jgi:regulatory protein